MISVRRHAAGQQVIIGLDNGVTLAVPEALIPGLAALPDAVRERVETGDAGHVLVWPGGPLYLSYLRLLTDILGARTEFSRLGPKRRTRED